MITKVKNVLVSFLCFIFLGILFSCTMNEASNDDIKKESPKKEKSSITLTLKVIYESNYTADYKLSGLPAGCNIYNAIAAFDEEFDEYLKSQQTGNVEAEKIDEGIRRVANIAPYEKYAIKKDNKDINNFTNTIFEEDTVLKVYVDKKSDAGIQWGVLFKPNNLSLEGTVYAKNITGGVEPTKDIYPAFGFISSSGKILWCNNTSDYIYHHYENNFNDYWTYTAVGLPKGSYKLVFLANGYLTAKSDINGHNPIYVSDISFFFSDSFPEDYYYTIEID